MYLPTQRDRRMLVCFLSISTQKRPSVGIPATVEGRYMKSVWNWCESAIFWNASLFFRAEGRTAAASGNRIRIFNGKSAAHR